MSNKNQYGVLSMVATPIGNLADMTFRAVDCLKQVDIILAESCCHSRHLLKHYGIHTKLKGLRAYGNSQAISCLKLGKNIAVITDAGTPIISDPGRELVYLAHEEGIKVVPIPGACAMAAALSVAGLPAQAFIFLGFLPTKSSARESYLKNLKEETKTLVFYEAPHRMIATLKAMCMVFGGSRYAVVAKELTKVFETVKTGSLNRLIEDFLSSNLSQKGEWVILLSGVDHDKKNSYRMEDALELFTYIQNKNRSISQDIGYISRFFGIRKNTFYEVIKSMNKLLDVE